VQKDKNLLDKQREKNREESTNVRMGTYNASLTAEAEELHILGE